LPELSPAWQDKIVMEMAESGDALQLSVYFAEGIIGSTMFFSRECEFRQGESTRFCASLIVSASKD
jgi:hypothetical protein